MISAEEANKIVNESENEILNTAKSKAILTFFEKKILNAASRGERVTRFMDDHIVDESGKGISTGSFYRGNDAIKRYMNSLGYRMICGDHGHIEISW